MTLARITAFLLPLAGAGFVLLVLRRFRHHCAYNNPLCRRDRPCIACYREMYEGRRSANR